MTARSAEYTTTQPQARAPTATQIELPATLLAPRLARQATRRALASWGLNCGDTADLIVSELVTNALRHASLDGTGIGLRLELSGSRLRIEVRDADPRPPQPRATAEPDESGLGLVIVETLAASWGSRPENGGKAVWAELDTGPPRRPSADPADCLYERPCRRAAI